MRAVLAGIILPVALTAGVAFGQPAPTPAFEVASIKVAPMPTAADAREGRLHVGMTVDAQRVDIGSDETKIFGNEGQMAKFFLHGIEEPGTRTLHPLS